MSGDAYLRLAHAAMAPDRVERLIATHGDVTRVVEWVLSGRSSVSESIAESIRVEASRRRADLAAMDVVFDTDLPDELRCGPDPPRWLFRKGAVPEGPPVAVIGSRRATAYGLSLARRIGMELALTGRVVVSGLARGVDAAAHRGMVEAGGQGIAVLGSGIDVWYPRQNRALGEQMIATGGCVISEFPPGTAPEAWRFPCRNRIIAGLSRVVVVVEAAARSGALITARQALEMGRDVFAVPGDIDRPTSAGCNLLIRDGAFPVTSIEEMSDAIDSVVGPRSGGAVQARELLWGLVGDVPVTLDALVTALGRPPGEVLAELSLHEARGEVIIEDGTVRLGRLVAQA